MRLYETLQRLRHVLSRLDEPPPRLPSPALDAELSRRLLESMLLTRHLDIAAHELREQGRGHYTISSAGHEGTVVLGALTRLTDPTFLHYRDTAVQLERARALAEVDAVRDILRSLVASASDPLCSGRHKALGSQRLGIIPQTSTIASHLPRAVGLALAVARRRHEGKLERYPEGTVVVAAFGDASLNHSTAQGALNAAAWAAHQNLPIPLLWVCEDNGLGISVRTPEGWVRERLRATPHLSYFEAPLYDVDAAYAAANSALLYCRRTSKPAVLHLSGYRLLGHAGSDADTSYRSPRELEEAMNHDPVLRFAWTLAAEGRLEASFVLELLASTEARVREAMATVLGEPALSTRGEVEAKLCRNVPVGYAKTPSEKAASARGLTLAQAIGATLDGALASLPDVLVFGEDVAKKGGVYGVTKGLLARHGPGRVFNTLLDEQTILGLALGLSLADYLPIPEIQYLAYLHNAEDQLRGEAATLPFFSNGAFDNPMLVRIPGLAYQKGFGGHFHNDNSLAVLRDIPGLIVAVPAHADDAMGLFQTALALAREQRRVVVMIEPIALYHTRDLYEAGDGLWCGSDARSVPYARAHAYHEQARDLTLITYGNGVPLCLRAARELAELYGIGARVLDLRWLSPLPEQDILEQAKATARVLVVDECRRSGNVSEGILALLAEQAHGLCLGRVTAADCFVPLGEAANLVLVQQAEVVARARELHAKGR
jgi:2-oxoisovalerate dehydrogenase E1 component